MVHCLPAYRMTRRDLRLGSGLVLFAYITAHLANHTLGLVSVNVFCVPAESADEVAGVAPIDPTNWKSPLSSTTD